MEARTLPIQPPRSVLLFVMELYSGDLGVIGLSSRHPYMEVRRVMIDTCYKRRVRYGGRDVSDGVQRLVSWNHVLSRPDDEAAHLIDRITL